MLRLAGWSRDGVGSGEWHPHTGFENVDVDLSDDDIAAKRNVRSLFMCFSQCVASARRLYGVSKSAPVLEYCVDD